jgi:tRNA-binding protein
VEVFPVIDIRDFEKVEMRVGKIIDVEMVPNAKHTTHILKIDFGKDLGIKKSGARVVRYSKEDLLGKIVICVTNIKPRQIGKFMSEVYTLGVPKDGECVLLVPDEECELGGKVY